jgi:hypothetical protein
MELPIDQVVVLLVGLFMAGTGFALGLVTPHPCRSDPWYEDKLNQLFVKHMIINIWQGIGWLITVGSLVVIYL